MQGKQRMEQERNKYTLKDQFFLEKMKKKEGFMLDSCESYGCPRYGNKKTYINPK